MDPWKDFHRITDGLELEVTFRDSPVHPFHHGYEHLSLDQAAQSPSQPDSEHFVNPA